jgi:hypothetical protein
VVGVALGEGHEMPFPESRTFSGAEVGKVNGVKRQRTYTNVGFFGKFDADTFLDKYYDIHLKYYRKSISGNDILF